MRTADCAWSALSDLEGNVNMILRRDVDDRMGEGERNGPEEEGSKRRGGDGGGLRSRSDSDVVI